MSGIVKSIAEKTPDVDTQQVAVTMGFALAFGVLAVLLSLAGQGTVWHGLLWAGAWSSVGWFLGFLFGIPRYLSTDTARTPSSPNVELAKNELASALVAAKDLRDAAMRAVESRAASADTAKQLAQAADQAESDAADTAMRSDADPLNTALQNEANAKANVAAKARRASDDAAGLAKEAAIDAQSSDLAASQADTAVEAAKAKVAMANTSLSASSGSSLTVNTNLEQISDWLTKIIVGVSLVESQTLLLKMHGVATFMAKSMTRADEMAVLAAASPSSKAASSAALAAESASAAASSALEAAKSTAKSLASFESTESFAYAVMLYFLATGLLGSYLLTRLFLQRALNDAAQRDAVPRLG
jgi:hypothetical protein